MRFVHSCSPFEEITALFEDEKPFGLWIQRKTDILPETIFLAKTVKKINNAWFTDIGGGRTAFLPSPKAYCLPDGTVSDKALTEGTALLVQVQRPSFEAKEIKVSAQISLPGELAVYTPLKPGCSFSRHLNEADKKRLEKEVEPFVLSGGCFTVRTAAGTAGPGQVKDEARRLENLWREITVKAKGLAERKKQDILYQPVSAAEQVAGQYKTQITEAVCDSAERHRDLKKIVPSVCFTTACLYDKENLEQVIQEVLDVSTRLPSGGSVFVEQTRACICFDVDAGAAAWQAANAEACREIVRQIRLKGLSGQMIIDFAGKKEKGSLKRLSSLLNADDFDLQVWGISALGLVELSLERTRPTLWETFSEQSKVKAAEILRQLWFAAIYAPPVVYAPENILSLMRPFMEQLEMRLGSKIDLKQSETCRIEGIRE